MPTLRRTLSLLRRPVSERKRALLAARWNELPAELRTDRQTLGRQIVHCGFTLGPSYCSFGCTHCYLPRNAGRTPLPTLDQMRAQIEANARLIGPDGGLQITGGDVVDAYWRAGRSDDLVEIVRYATEAGVVPMLMTHGQVLLDHPELLDRLAIEGGLRRLALHIDITQGGRPGFPLKNLRSEADLHPLRERFVDLVLGSRRRTGVRLRAAHTVTVTDRNLDSIGEIVRWIRADRRRSKVFSMVSFQTEAEVGRTRISRRPVTPEAAWRRISDGAGLDLCHDTLQIGHPDCNRFTTLWIDHRHGRTVELFSAGEPARRWVAKVLRVFGGVGSRGPDDLEATLRRLALLARHPSILPQTVRFAADLLRRTGGGARTVMSSLRSLATGKIGTLNLVMHNFMSTRQVLENEPRTAERLAACSFRGAVQRDGEWVSVPMCTLNARERETLYDRQIAGGRALVEIGPGRGADG